MNVTWWRYPTRRFTVSGHKAEVRFRARLDGLVSELRLDGQPVDTDHTPIGGEEAVRNHDLSAALPSGERLEVEAGYVSIWSVGITARLDRELVHASHPGKALAYPEKYRDATVNMDGRTFGEAIRNSWKGENSKMQAKGYDPGRLARNKVPIMVDIALGILFFIVAKLTDLPTAALVGAAAGIALVVLQRFVKADLLGGLALFGIVLLLISAGLALAFQDDMAVKMRSTIVGTIGSVLFLGDGLLGGNRLGRAMSRYMAYNDVDPARLALGMGLLGLAAAGANYLVATYTSTDTWLLYSTFVDFFLFILMFLAVLAYARGKWLPRGYKPPAPAIADEGNRT
jgi:intracellular septation protein A